MAAGVDVLISTNLYPGDLIIDDLPFKLHRRLDAHHIQKTIGENDLILSIDYPGKLLYFL